LQSDQKIIGTGFTNKNSKFHFLLARFKTDGSLDSAFANGGKNTNGLEAGMAVAILKDDKIVVLTDSSSLKQFTKDGVTDTSFGNGGKVSVPFEAKAIAVQSNKIIVVGVRNNNFAVACYEPTGKLDKAFGINGIAVANFGGNDEAYAAAIQQNGKIITAGSSDSYKLAVARFNWDTKTSLTANAVINDKNDALKRSLSVQLYPNPFQYVLNIDFAATDKMQKRIGIYDMNGKLLLSKCADVNMQLDVKQLPAGTYLIKITDENGKELYSGKVIKQ
jgi:uncharacterized delta-60 repeat protein